jgi:hypothetical protein
MTARKRIRQQKAVWPKPGEKPGPPASFRKKVRAFPGAKLALEKVTGAGLNKKLVWLELWEMTRPADESRPRAIQWQSIPGLPLHALRRFPSQVRSWADKVQLVGERIRSNEAYGHLAHSHSLRLFLESQVGGKNMAELSIAKRVVREAPMRSILERCAELPKLAELPSLLRFYADYIEVVCKLTAHHAPKAQARFKTMLLMEFIDNVKRLRGSPQIPEIATLLTAAYHAHDSGKIVDAHNLSMQYSRHTRRKQ